MTYQSLSIAVLLGISIFSAYANPPTSATQPSAAIAQPTTSVLPTSIADKVSQAGLTLDKVGIWVKPLNGKAPIIHHQAEVPRTPASTQKLITTAIALHLMSEHYHWQTRLYADGVVVGDTLYGNLVIKGSGDPSMTHERLNAMLSQLAERGVRHIRGDIIIDNVAFVDVARDVNAFDGQGLRAYNAQPNAFLINFGTIEVSMTPSGVWQTPMPTEPTSATFLPNDNQVTVRVLPRLADFIVPVLITGKQGECSKPKFGLTKQALTITGLVGMDCGQISEWLTFADADEFIIKAVKGAWQDIDGDFQGVVKMRSLQDEFEGRLPLLSYASKPLAEQIYQINQYSNNVMTEQVALSLPLFMGESHSNYAKTFALMDAWWAKHLTTPKPVMSRASGLCRDCAIAPHALGELLEFSHQQSSFETFKRSLPIVGQTGTMKDFARRHPNSPVIGRAFIKTGRLANVASIAGYVMGQSGQMYVVVAMINADGAGNNTRAHAVLDEVIEWTAGQP